MGIDAVILAGGRGDPAGLAEAGVESWAMMPVRGKPMYAHVLNAVLGCEQIDRVSIAGNVPEGEGYTVIEPGASLLENVRKGLEGSMAEWVLFVTADIPFVTSEALSRFIADCQESGADICYAIVPAEACRAKFPNIKRTTAKLREGEFTGGNLFFVRRQSALGQLHRLEELYAYRKSPVRLAMVIGLGVLIRFVLARLISPKLISLRHVEERASLAIGVPARAIVSPYAEVGADIDTAEQWRLATQAERD
ncbi:MAG: NTP transferase domain-containing protein [Armatimonadetes bacterium]|nr:NTP transferase domain-containing protein [Armatimonadota bacterium]